MPPLLLVLAAILMAVVHAPQHDRVSPIDEYSYIDYVDKFPQQGVVRQGEDIGDFARNYYICHGSELFRGQPEYELFGPRPDLCDDPAVLERDAEFPQGGKVSADIYTPLYFAVTWTVSQPLEWAGIENVLAWRLSGALWLAMAAVLLYAGAMRWGANRSSSWAMSMMMVASPVALWSNTYVSTDATALFAGALMLYLGAGVYRGRCRPVVFGLAAALVTALKLQNFLAVAAVSLCLILIHALRRRGDSGVVGPWTTSGPVRAALIAVAASGATQVVWTIIRARISSGPSPDLGVSMPYSLRRVGIDMTYFFPGSLETMASLEGRDLAQFLVVTVMKLLVVGGVLAAVFVLPRRDPAVALAGSTLLIALTAGPALGAMVWFASGEYVVPAPRYGISLIPIYLALAARMLSHRPRLSLPAALVAVVALMIALVAYV